MQAVTHEGLLDVMGRRVERVLFQVGVQPPARAVCQRLLKPRPSVYLVVPPLRPSSSTSSSPSSSSSSSSSAKRESLRRLYAALDSTTPSGGVFVVASAVRLDSGALVPRGVDGQATVRLEKCEWHEGVYKATFDKVKLMVTSSQCAGTKFALGFRLRCKSLDLGDLVHLAVTSSPIEVYSHLQYLTQAQEIERAVNSVKEREADQPDQAEQQAESKYGGNGVGLQLKIMQLIHAYREQGGDEDSLHESVTAMYKRPMTTRPSSRRSWSPTSSASSPPSSSRSTTPPLPPSPSPFPTSRSSSPSPAPSPSPSSPPMAASPRRDAAPPLQRPAWADPREPKRRRLDDHEATTPTTTTTSTTTNSERVRPAGMARLPSVPLLLSSLADAAAAVSPSASSSPSLSPPTVATSSSSPAAPHWHTACPRTQPAVASSSPFWTTSPWSSLPMVAFPAWPTYGSGGLPGLAALRLLPPPPATTADHMRTPPPQQQQQWPK